MIKINDIEIGNELPLIALKNVVLFPRIVIPLTVQRLKSVAALEYAIAHNGYVAFVAQTNMKDEAGIEDFYRIGTLGRIISTNRASDGSFKVDVEGVARVRIDDFTQEEPFFKVQAELARLSYRTTVESEALIRATIDEFKKVSEAKMMPSILPSLIFTLNQIKDPEQLIDLVTVNLNLSLEDQQNILETFDINIALKQLNLYLARELEIIDAERKVVKETKKQLGKMQKEIFLREQMKSIEKELGMDGEQGEYDQLRQKIKKAGMPEETQKKALKELDRLEKMPMFSPEVSYLRTYLDWLIELPWSNKSPDKIDMKKAENVLEAEHHGLQKTKERILEHLAVQKKVGKVRGPILCFFGPPGTGKTSIGRSIASALGRKFIRVSFGGLRDEAEIRGHRRTYVGALPGRIIQGIHTSGTRNPVFMLDEIDKIGQDFRGDPSAALLEALDPEQNFSFSDNYLEVPFDLSDVLFIATANMLDTIPPALRDRLEIIEFPGYTEDEKLAIAKKFLMPKLAKQHGLANSTVSISDGIFRDIIQQHTREAGVRELERKLSTIFRKITRKVVESGKSDKTKIKLTEQLLHKFLGSARYTHQVTEKKDEIGVATGLVWTPVGGEILSIEATKMDGRGRLVLTGHLGNVMRESIQAALSYVRANAVKLGIKEDFYKSDIHVHVPSGGIPKDGPSAGVGMITAIVSLLTKRPVRKEVAMTGEITLRGKVLEIGGIKEKILAAHRAGVKTIVLPAENKKDLEDLPPKVRQAIKFVLAKNIDEVLAVALK
ncbi:MAG: endopeptidase La [Candidatus Yanofskybacteria bacterium RIFCSPLOWO2_02_FULL_45_10]|uniref:Lon protease n=2 Tax=Candidatus Yanofskyibacteriota TaxID=1752733 RepID=A0A1F8G259_9BACT|nr:MAG: endopeptidase La [Candidatus Yanofskybacteria bacterium RIFCSPHIGHO2_12_FULL_45_19b]OGN32994.1 MAG: endopeptidase La [Candidatus Yanofskybacteria bacterium RIFCSPLOWO2_02_FULL_45_10]